MGYVLSCGSTVRAAAHIHDSHSHTPCNSKSTQILWNLPHVRAQSHATKRYLAVERPQVTRVERIGPVLFCAACSCVAANHSSDISRHKLLTKWRTAWSPILKARNRQEYTPPCIIQYRIYTSWIFEPRRSLRRWERVGMIRVRLWVKMYLHRRPAVA